MWGQQRQLWSSEKARMCRSSMQISKRWRRVEWRRQEWWGRVREWTFIHSFIYLYPAFLPKRIPMVICVSKAFICVFFFWTSTWLLVSVPNCAIGEEKKSVFDEKQKSFTEITQLASHFISFMRQQLEHSHCQHVSSEKQITDTSTTSLQLICHTIVRTLVEAKLCHIIWDTEKVFWMAAERWWVHISE